MSNFMSLQIDEINMYIIEQNTCLLLLFLKINIHMLIASSKRFMWYKCRISNKSLKIFKRYCLFLQIEIHIYPYSTENIYSMVNLFLNHLNQSKGKDTVKYNVHFIPNVLKIVNKDYTNYGNMIYTILSRTSFIPTLHYFKIIIQCKIVPYVICSNEWIT